jgi:hypothetical protein
MNFEFKRKCVLLLASSVFIANAAGAQTLRDPRSEAKVHVGPLYLTPRLAVEEFGIDTNVFNNTEEKQDFTFTLAPHVAAGDYVVRMTVNDQQAGMRVSVTSGQTVANALIVAPSAAAPSAAFLAALGLLGGLLTGAAIAAAVITTAVVVTGS